MINRAENLTFIACHSRQGMAWQFASLRKACVVTDSTGFPLGIFSSKNLEPKITPINFNIAVR